jgi:hypothetical protein
MPSIKMASVESVISSANSRSSGGLELEGPVLPREQAIHRFERRNIAVFVDRAVHDLAAAQVDAAHVFVATNDEHARLLAGRKELQQVDEPDLREVAAHRAHLAGAASGGGLLQLDLGVGLRARHGLAVGERDADDARPDEDLVALFQASATDLLAVDEGAVGRSEVFDDQRIAL